MARTGGCVGQRGASLRPVGPNLSFRRALFEPRLATVRVEDAPDPHAGNPSSRKAPAARDAGRLEQGARASESPNQNVALRSAPPPPGIAVGAIATDAAGSVLCGAVK